MVWLTLSELFFFFNLNTGTSTHDGKAVAKATLQYLINHVMCATLFVTHFPEISSLASESRDGQVVNLHMDYMLLEKTEQRDGECIAALVPDVVFLYRVVRGEAGTSHGLNVAQLAGLPPHLLSIAQNHHETCCKSDHDK